MSPIDPTENAKLKEVQGAVRVREFFRQTKRTKAAALRWIILDFGNGASN
jgi:hypothetical protein